MCIEMQFKVTFESKYSVTFTNLKPVCFITVNLILVARAAACNSNL